MEEIYKTLEKKPDEFKKEGIKPRVVGLLKEHKEEADFSKILATIRRDAPIDFHLPEKEWKENFDISKTEDVFRELEFRTLGARVRSVFSTRYQSTNAYESTNNTNKDEIKNRNQTNKLRSESSSETSKLINFPETSVALWLPRPYIFQPSI